MQASPVDVGFDDFLQAVPVGRVVERREVHGVQTAAELVVVVQQPLELFGSGQHKAHRPCVFLCERLQDVQHCLALEDVRIFVEVLRLVQVQDFDLLKLELGVDHFPNLRIRTTVAARTVVEAVDTEGFQNANADRFQVGRSGHIQRQNDSIN